MGRVLLPKACTWEEARRHSGAIPAVLTASLPATPWTCPVCKEWAECQEGVWVSEAGVGALLSVPLRGGPGSQCRAVRALPVFPGVVLEGWVEGERNVCRRVTRDPGPPAIERLYNTPHL